MSSTPARRGRSTQPQPLRCPPQGDIELMSKKEILDLKSALRLEQATSEEEQASHEMMPRSALIARIRPDRIFGNDKSSRCACRLLSPLTRVGIRIVTFEGCSGFTHITARQIAQPPIGDLCHQAPTHAVTRTSRSSATGSIDNSPVGFFLH
jgi:hypothetical protein